MFLHRRLRDLFTDNVQHLPPLLLNFFARFLPLWDGSGRRDSMFEILSYSPLLDFQGNIIQLLRLVLR
jgi:centromere protein I